MAISSCTQDNFYEYYLLSTDTKPMNDHIANGSICVEMDKGKVFFFDLDAYKAGKPAKDVWIEPKD